MNKAKLFDKMLVLANKIGRLPKPLIVIFTILFIVLVGFLDYITGNEITFTIFYLVPVGMGVWYLGGTWGLIISTLSALLGVYFDDILVPRFYTNNIILFWNMAVRALFFIVVSALLNRLKHNLETESRLAREDPVTKIANPRSFYETAEKELYRSKRYKRDISLAYLDVDNFKKVNDTFGHDLGDKLLRAIAGVLKENVRNTDLAARLGGDEFAIFFPETGEEEVKQVIEKLRCRLDEMIGETKYPVSFSIGVVTCPGGDCMLQDMIKAADTKMYEMKKSGKNKACYYTLK